MKDPIDSSMFDPDVLPPREDGLALLSNDAMRARRRPLAIALTWLWEAAVALIVAWPTASAVHRVYGAHPHGDAALWAPGALDLFNLLVHETAARSSIIVLAALTLLVASIAGLYPLSGLIVSIAYAFRVPGGRDTDHGRVSFARAPSVRAALARGASSFTSLLLLMVLAVVAQAAVTIVALVAGVALASNLEVRLGEARAEQLGVLLGLLIFAFAAIIGVVHDLARAAAIRFRVGAIRATRLGLNTLKRGPASITFSWMWRAIAALAPIAVGSIVAERLGLRAGAALFTLFVVHQLVVGTRVALRASWIAKALRAVDHAHRVVRVRDE